METPKVSFIRVPIDRKLKIEVETMFRRFGLSATEAVNLFYRQVRRTGGLPFKTKTPNALTRKVLAQTDQNVGVVSFKDKAEFFRDLGMR